MMLEVYLAHWESQIAGTLAPTTCRVYRGQLARYVRGTPFGARDLVTIRRLDVRAFLVGLRSTAPRSVPRQLLRILSSAFASAVDDDRIATNPCQGAGRKLFARDEPAPKHLEDEHFTALIAAAVARNPKVAVAFFTAGRLGLRPGEVVALERADVDLDARMIRVDDTFAEGILRGTTKGGRTRFVDCADDLAWVLSGWLAEGAGPRWLFPGRWVDRPMSTRNLVEQFHTAANDIGLVLPARTGPHALRHTFGTALAQRKIDMRYIQGQLGHRSIVTTERYVSGARERDVAAVNLLREPVRHGPVRLVATSRPLPASGARRRPAG